MERRIHPVWGLLAIVALVATVYLPVLPGCFLLDDQRLVESANPLVNGEFGPLTIWFQTDFTLSSFVFWLEWLAWGENPLGYHVVNLALQAFSAMLVWRVLGRLKIPGAWLAAALFAIHPVCVESVARIAELKNTLSLPCFLLSFWCYLRYEAGSLYPANPDQSITQKPVNSGMWWYGLSLMTFVLALLGKTSTVMLPMVLLGCAAWQRGRITRRDLIHTGPHFLLALAFGLLSVWFQKHQALALTGQVLPPESFWMRLAIASRIFWFYLGKALLPMNLTVIYPRWNIDAGAPATYLPVLFLGAGFVLCWRFRRAWGRPVLFGLGVFAIALFPALGFFNAQFLTKFQVSDYLQYLPLIAPVALVAAGLASRWTGRAFFCAAVALLLILSVLTFKRAGVFGTEEGLLRDTLVKNPAAGEAYNNLGVILAKRKDYDGAINHFRTSLQCDPNNAEAHLNLGQALGLQGRFQESEPHFLAALRIRPGDPETHKQFAHCLGHMGRNREAVLHLKTALWSEPKLKPEIETRLELASLLYQTGDLRGSTSQFRRVLSFQPDLPEALNNLAWLLATGADAEVRDGVEAVRCAERACRLTEFKQAGMISTLAAAYAEAGRFPEAVTTAETALNMQTETGDTRSAAINRQLLMFYRDSKSWHEPPVAGR